MNLREKLLGLFTVAAALLAAALIWKPWGDPSGMESKAPRSLAESDDMPAFLAPRMKTAIDALQARVDPESDGWETEVMAEQTAKQLAVLAGGMSRPGTME